MARKNLIEFSNDPLPEELSADNAPSALTDRPIAGLTPQRPAMSVGGITRSLQNIASRVERAEDAEKKLAEGQVVIELDPSVIDNSFVADRLVIATEGQQTLIQQIREHGQQVPILVRPHPQAPGRFQVAYGHRRLAAVKAIGIKVKAAIRSLTDEQLVVAQGQENNARTDLTYIERAYFARRLEDRSFDRATIMAALAVDKAALSKMIGLTKRLPVDVIEGVGAAPGIGRRRWEEFADLLEQKGVISKVRKYLESDSAKGQESAERFEALFKLNVQPKSRQTTPAEVVDGVRAVGVRPGNRSTQLIFDNQAAPGFADFVQQRMQSLYDEFMRNRGA